MKLFNLFGEGVFSEILNQKHCSQRMSDKNKFFIIEIRKYLFKPYFPCFVTCHVFIWHLWSDYLIWSHNFLEPIFPYFLFQRIVISFFNNLTHSLRIRETHSSMDVDKLFHRNSISVKSLVFFWYLLLLVENFLLLSFYILVFWLIHNFPFCHLYISPLLVVFCIFYMRKRKYWLCYCDGHHIYTVIYHTTEVHHRNHHTINFFVRAFFWERTHLKVR